MIREQLEHRFAVSGMLCCIVLCLVLGGCSPRATPTPQERSQTTLHVLAAETFLADIVQNVAGDRVKIEALMPIGTDPHSFEPTPGDVRKVADCSVLIVNGAGVEEFLDELLKNAGGQHLLIEASIGLTSRTLHEGEAVGNANAHHEEGDPHFWLDPNYVIKYVENIRDGLSHADPDGTANYVSNTQVYIAKLQQLDQWVRAQVEQVPAAQRQLVTNHESLGYYADRYGFTVVGSIVPSVSSSASPSAQQMTQLVTQMEARGVRAIFLETGNNSQLAQQIALETGIQVVTELYTHSTTAAGGPAPTYIDMIKYDTQAIVAALR